MNISDDIYTGPLGPNGFVLQTVGNPNPTKNYGVGPLGRIMFRIATPTALSPVAVAPLQAPTAGVPLALAAGPGVTRVISQDGLSQPLYNLGSTRCITLTSAANLSAITFLVVMVDEYGRRQTQLMTGPNANTVTSLKTARSIVSVTPQGTSANLVSVGTADVFGFQFRITDATYIVSAKWDNTLAQNAGTFVPADVTSPATALTGDPRGTFQPAGAASNGVRILVVAFHVDATQCGPTATLVNAIGVTPV